MKKKTHWGYLFKNTVFKCWFRDGCFRHSCLMRKSGALLAACPEDTSTQLLWHSSFLPYPNPPGVKITRGGALSRSSEKALSQVQNPLRVKSHGWFPQRQSLSMGGTHLPFSLQIKGIMYFFPSVPLFPLGKHRLDLVFWFPARSHHHMAWFP